MEFGKINFRVRLEEPVEAELHNRSNPPMDDESIIIQFPNHPLQVGVKQEG